MPSINNLKAHSSSVFKTFEVAVKRSFPYGENEWHFYIRKWLLRSVSYRWALKEGSVYYTDLRLSLEEPLKTTWQTTLCVLFSYRVLESQTASSHQPHTHTHTHTQLWPEAAVSPCLCLIEFITLSDHERRTLGIVCQHVLRTWAATCADIKSSLTHTWIKGFSACGTFKTV